MKTNQKNVVPNFVMQKLTKFIPVPIRLCCLSKENPRLHLSYCKNKGLLHAVSLIGEYKGLHSRKSSYKRGIDYLYIALNMDKDMRYHISKTEIRRLIYPCNKRKHCLKVPFNTIFILNKIVEYVDNPLHSQCHIRCKEMKDFYCKDGNRTDNKCFAYLVKEE